MGEALSCLNCLTILYNLCFSSSQDHFGRIAGELLGLADGL